jgi:hypothetical protein
MIEMPMGLEHGKSGINLAFFDALLKVSSKITKTTSGIEN